MAGVTYYPTVDNQLEKARKDMESNLFLELSALAPSESTRKLIKEFTDRRDLASLTATFESKLKADLVATLQYLGVTLLDISPTEKCAVTDFRQKDLARILVSRFALLVPEICTACNNPHTTPKDETPLIKCFSCDRGIHSDCLAPKLGDIPADPPPTPAAVDAFINPLQISGLVYLCSACSLKCKKAYPEPLEKVKKAMQQGNNNRPAVPGALAVAEQGDVVAGDAEEDLPLPTVTQQPPPPADGQQPPPPDAGQQPPPPGAGQ